MIGARGRERTCQEASPLSREEYIACGRPAVCIVDSGDFHPYWMCEYCADHNIRNRGGVQYDRHDLAKSDLLAGAKGLVDALDSIRGELGMQYPALSEAYVRLESAIAKAEGSA